MVTGIATIIGAFAVLEGMLRAGLLCNDARLQGPAEEEPRWKPLGDPTEVALLSLAMKGGVVPAAVRDRARGMGDTGHSARARHAGRAHRR